LVSIPRKLVWNWYQVRNTKGTVAIEEYRGRLRLRWSYQGQRYCLTLGLPATKFNRKAAQQKATQIELDMATGIFDTSLQRYSPHKQNQSNPAIRLSCSELFKAFTEYKAQIVYRRTLIKYRSLPGYLEAFFGPKQARLINSQDAERFTVWFGQQGLTPISVRERLHLLKATWDWGIQNGLVESNPWLDIPGRVKVPPKQMPKPFTREEISTIVKAFRSDRYYFYYADYVEFLFGTGCRTSEAIGLRWKHVADDCSTVWIGETLTRGVRKATKTNRARTITLNSRLQSLLLALKPVTFDPEALVFTALEGGPIDDNNFRNRAWMSILNKLGIEYRKPYTTRHTFISHALDLGMNPVMIAHLTGHDVQTLYQNYAGCVSSRPRLPDLEL
jgi:integrase